MAEPAQKGPVGEIGGIGSLGSLGVLGGRGGSWAAFMSEGERVPELRWPESVRWYEWMLTDSQVWSLYEATALPLVDYVWWVEPGRADEGMAAALAADLGLPLGEPAADAPYEPPAPGLYRFNFIEHLEEALLAMAYGHYYFEQVGEVAVDGDGLWHLRKLGPRAPQTIQEFQVAPDGGLVAIQQSGVVASQRGQTMYAGRVPPIPVDRLVAYVWHGDARNRWVGRSLLRPLYRHWLVKDVLIRVDAINHQRAGGVPWVKTDASYQGLNLDDLQQVAAQFRVGEEAGAALPPGAELMLARIQGTDVVASINYHDEAMARVWQAMVIQLGQTRTGSRALGGTFQDLQSFARRAIARWFTMTFREHVIEDWWAYNVPRPADGSPSPHPTLACRPPAPDAAASAGPAVAPGDPSQQQQGGGGPPGADPPQAAARRSPRPRASTAAAPSTASSVRLPDRPLRREPNEWEVRAAVDFAALDHAHEDAAGALETYWRGAVLPEQIAAVSDAIVLTKSGAKRKRVTRTDMARLQVPALGADRFRELLLPAAQAGARGASAEAAAQGVAVGVPADEALAAMVADHAGALAEQTASGLALAAQRKAVQLASGRAPAEVAAGVTSYLGGLAHQWEADQLAGAAQMALNAGRFAVMGLVDQPSTFVASELLDANTCDPCAAEDGREFRDLDEATAEYPSGGYVDCDGGPRCRGTVVAVYDEAGA